MSTDSTLRAHRRGSSARSQIVAGWLFLAPSLVILAVFVFWPIIQSVVLSLHQWRFGAAVQDFVGAANYEKMWKDPRAWNALKNTVYFTVFFVPLGVVIPLALALLLNRAIPARTLFSPAIANHSGTSATSIGKTCRPP